MNVVLKAVVVTLGVQLIWNATMMCLGNYQWGAAVVAGIGIGLVVAVVVTEWEYRNK